MNSLSNVNGTGLPRMTIVSCVPAVSFWRPENAAAGRSMIRFAFPKRPETLHAAAERLRGLTASRALGDVVALTVLGERDGGDALPS